MKKDIDFNKKTIVLSFVVWTILFFSNASCKDKDSKNNKIEDTQNQSIESDITTTKNQLDETTSKSKDSLLSFFDLKADNFKYKTYYHKSWFGKYIIRDNTLLCGLDTIGNLFLISTLLVPDDKVKHTSVSIKIDNNIFISSEVPCDNFPHEIMIGTSYIQSNIYSEKKDSILIAAIAQNVSKYIVLKYNGRTKYSVILSLRDKKAISDCYYLANIIHKK
jgi:hypothetical protein